MFRAIMVPLDGSSFAEAAIAAACRLAQPSSARLLLTHVHQPVPTLVGAGEIAAPPVDLDSTFREQGIAYLGAAVNRVADAGCRDVRALQTEGSPGPSLCALIQQEEIDLVVMNSHARSGFNRLWLGSVAEHVIRHSGVPVLLVRATDGATAAATGGGGLLVTMDFSPESMAVVLPAQDLAIQLGLPVTLLHVVDPELAGPSGMQAAEDALAHVADRLRDRCRVTVRVLLHRNPAAAILAEAERGRYDAMAVSTRGAGALKRLFVGSVAARLLRASPVPVLAVHPLGPDRGHAGVTDVG